MSCMMSGEEIVNFSLMNISRNTQLWYIITTIGIELRMDRMDHMDMSIPI